MFYALKIENTQDRISEEGGGNHRAIVRIN